MRWRKWGEGIADVAAIAGIAAIGESLTTEDAEEH
jgi:hypothetical protein